MQKTEEQRTPGRYGLEEIAENQLEAWPNDYVGRDYTTHFEIPEFTVRRISGRN